jgi:ankyrin repeat protein
MEFIMPHNLQKLLLIAMITGFCGQTQAADAVRHALTSGIDVNQRPKGCEHTTYLHMAAEEVHGDLTMILELIAAGAEVNALDSTHDTPLHRAAMMGHLAIVQALITAGADVNAKDSFGITPLHMAAQNGHTAIGKFLVSQAGANKNLCNMWGESAADTALIFNKHEIHNYLTSPSTISNVSPEVKMAIEAHAMSKG